jgi:hypothetical protein
LAEGHAVGRSQERCSDADERWIAVKALRIAAATLQLLLALGAGARADVFHSSYLSFELPLGWKCNLEGVEWVCGDQTEGKQKTAFIIVTAKEQGSEDRLDLYEDQLSTTKPLMDAKGMPTGRSSTLEFVKRETIGDKVWVHGRQFESEAPNYYTDYFATVSDHIAILVTFSAYRQNFQAAFDRFYPSIATLRPKTHPNH